MVKRIVEIAAALLAVAAFGGGGATAPAEHDAPPARVLAFTAPSAAIADHAPLTARGARLLRATTWWGGPYTAATGETVTVFLSAAYPQDERLARRWADFFAGLVHGSELALVRVYVAPPAEVEEVCDAHALGCYGGNRLVTMGEDADGVSAESVAAHEYGHHIAAHRLNPPWRALDWGPKRWASAMAICGRAAAGTAFPGGGGSRYALNPGEAFAESYRLLNERRADPAASSWPILDSSLFPSAAALFAAEEDVVRPWTAPATTVRRWRLSGARKVWTTRVATSLDGELRVTLDLPPATPYRLEVAGAGGPVLARGLWSSSTRQVAQTTICGLRAVTVRVVREGPPARFAVRVAAP